MNEALKSADTGNVREKARAAQKERNIEKHDDFPLAFFINHTSCSIITKAYLNIPSSFSNALIKSKKAEQRR